MKTFKINNSSKKTILALGPESAGNFSIFHKGKIYFSEDFGNLLEDENFDKYKHELNKFLKKNKIKPAVILTDHHPLYKTTSWGQELAKKYKTKHIEIQHHLAHIFSAIGDKLVQDAKYKIRNEIFGIAMDGTGYGLDEKIWGGEIFKIHQNKFKRIGHLENQTLIGGDLAIKEPVRMLIGILGKFLPKQKVFEHTKRHYTRNEFELIYNQFRQSFNCLETSSAGRILDAASVLLGFADNKRKYKHEPTDLLEKNSTQPYTYLKPHIIYDKKEKLYVLQTTPIFEYLIKNIPKGKKRLAATAQLYLAQGLYKIIKKSQLSKRKSQIFIAGGISNNKIISSYLESRDAYKNEKIPRGDAGLSFGQVVFYLLTNSRN